MRITTDEQAARVQDRPAIGLRWWIDRFGGLRYGWPPAGEEQHCATIGWVAAGEPMGVIIATELGVTRSIMDTLEERFPGRSWYEGSWSGYGSGDGESFSEAA